VNLTSDYEPNVTLSSAMTVFGVVVEGTFSFMPDKDLDTSKLVCGLCINWFC